ncbi:hypothetical protein GCM10008938_21560 [Deinococcus roseus]|uniref:Uncharacterized protein n=1 Tax=Deinococcus roseus TaxID=392414 RepID=A0ABQ2D0N8_9DEIO|nr:hypothetical protein GCM10008938_21560 [Deinococcus roseus]
MADCMDDCPSMKQFDWVTGGLGFQSVVVWNAGDHETLPVSKVWEVT